MKQSSTTRWIPEPQTFSPSLHKKNAPSSTSQVGLIRRLACLFSKLPQPSQSVSQRRLGHRLTPRLRAGSLAWQLDLGGQAHGQVGTSSMPKP